MLKTLTGSFILREKITTTEAKAKELKSLIDQIINKAKKAQDVKLKSGVTRELIKKLPFGAVKKLTSDFIGNFKERGSGYTRITKLGRRKGDSAKMAVIEFIK